MKCTIKYFFQTTVLIIWKNKHWLLNVISSSIYTKQMYFQKKKKVQSSERRWTGGNSPAVPLKAVSIEKDRAILPRYLWQAYGVKTILWIFSSLHSLLLHWDPDKRLCFEPHTSGKPKTAMDSNRNAQHTMLLL